VAPTDEQTHSLDALSQQLIPQVKKDTEEKLGKLSKVEIAALSALPEDAISQLIGRSKVNQVQTITNRDRFLLSEWTSGFSQMLNQAKKSNGKDDGQIQEALKSGDLSPVWKPLTEKQLAEKASESLHKGMSKKGIVRIANIVAGTAALGALYFGVGHGPAWAVHLIDQMYSNYWPDVLKDATYRITLLKSSLALSSFVPLLYAAGMFMDTEIYKRGWGAIKSIAKTSFVVASKMSLPFFNYIADLAKQPNFLKAMRLGVNPIMPVKTAEGYVWPALTSPFVKSKDVNSQIKERGQLLEAKAAVKTKRIAKAWALTAIVLGNKNDIDPATITVLAQNGGVSHELLEKASNDNEFLKQWGEAAEELSATLSSIKADDKDIRELSQEELIEAVRLAQNTIDKIKERQQPSRMNEVRRKLATFKRLWRTIPPRVAKGIANWGVAESRFLKDAVPSDYVTSQFWKQFVIDYLLAVVQMGLVGERAHIATANADPNSQAAKALAADHKGEFWRSKAGDDPGSRLWTSPGHLADMADQVRIYGLRVPADTALVYQRTAVVIEENYRPIEELTLRGNLRPDSFFHGTWVWIKGAGDIANADYAGIFLKSLQKSLKTIQAAFIWGMLARVAFGGQHWAATSSTSLL
jgi:ribosomal protein L29